MSTRPAGREDGVALFAVLVLLFVMGWFALSAFRISSQQLQIVGNGQAEHQATAAAQRAIDLTISSNAFSKDPAAVAAIPVATDVDGDGDDDFTARLEPAPKCIRVRPIKTMELDIAKAADRVCLQSVGGSGNLVVRPGAVVASGDSLCANSEWNIAAAVFDPTTNTAVSVQQGVAIRVVATDAKNFCK
jgi:Tfp pilus assembly protein PilX